MLSYPAIAGCLRRERIPCRIRAIPGELEAITCLKHLLLGYNKISGFRGNIYLMNSLETLDLGHNRQDENYFEVSISRRWLEDGCFQSSQTEDRHGNGCRQGGGERGRYKN